VELLGQIGEVVRGEEGLHVEDVHDGGSSDRPDTKAGPSNRTHGPGDDDRREGSAVPPLERLSG
jgi:hypothetical protein